jgi:hypothetical protein
MAFHAELRVLPRPTEAGAAPAGATRPPLSRGERVLMTEKDSDGGGSVVVTAAALYHYSHGWRRLPWEELGRIRRTPDGHALELTRFGAAPVRLRISASSRLPAVVRDLVAATELIGTPVTLVEGRTGSVSARRRPGTGETVWVVRLPDGTDPADPGVQARVDTAIRELRPLL